MTSRVFLIGYRGCGKTSVARQLAMRLGYDWVDADVELELQAGKTIATIFAEEGESGFRDREQQVIAELCRRDRTVVALGGGAVLREANREAIRAAGVVIWLQASVSSLAARIRDDPLSAARRPNLTKSGGRNEIEQVLAQRTPIYRAAATWTVDTEGKTVAEVVEEVLARPAT
jgi:shikimate kinase